MTSTVMVTVKIKKCKGFRDRDYPMYATRGSSGLDLMAALDTDYIHIWPGMRKLIQTGISIAIPEGYETVIRPRSGLAYKHGITCLNSPGTIDSDYRGPVGVILINHGEDRVRITNGERIAQMVLQEVPKVRWAEVDSLDDTDRGHGGYGSTG